MISKEYKNTLKTLAIQKFVNENKRSPTVAEMQYLLHEIQKKYHAVDVVGLSGSDIEKPLFRQVSSATTENNNRKVILSDLLTLNTKLDNLIDMEEAAYRSSIGTIARANKTLDELMGRVDNLLLIYGQGDDFLYGFEETFANQQYVDHTNSTACIHPSNVTLGKRKLDFVGSDSITAKFSVVAERGYSSYYANGSLNSLLKDNGDVWQCKVKTPYQIGRVALIIELSFSKLVDVSSLKLFGLPSEVSKPMYTTVSYARENGVLVAIEPVEQELTQAFILPINASGVKKIQLIISKNAADVPTGVLNEYEYHFELDKIVLESSNYILSSSLICGPYTIVDYNGNEVFPTKASLTACTKEPAGTGIAFYLSTDGTNWHSLNHLNKTSNYVSFGDNTPEKAIGQTDLSKDSHVLLNTLDSTEQFDYRHEAYLNSYILADYANIVSKHNINIKRGIVYSENISEALGTALGWTHNRKKGTYSCYVNIKNAEGRIIDLGPKGAILNDKKVTGETLFPNGISKFETDSSNWVDIETNILSDTELEKVDPLYPYNHKYIISGYSYPVSFLGDRPYKGVNEYFAYQMYYISPEEFEALEPTASNYYRVFTIEQVDDNLYFKVKVNKNSSTWMLEGFELDFVTQNVNPISTIYVKAVLNSNAALLTPVLESFKVRVV